MADLQSRVEDYIGTFADTGALDNWLSTESAKVIDLLPEKVLLQFATTQTIDKTTGVSLADFRPILGTVNIAGYPANQINSNEVAPASDSDSIFYANAQSPNFYIKASAIYILPSTVNGNLEGVVYPTAVHTDTTIGSFPDSFVQTVVLGTAGQAQLQRINNVILNIDGITFTAPTAPTAPSAPSITYLEATLGTIAATTLTALGSAPSYSVTLPTAPTISLSGTAPTVPSAPSISYSDASAGAISATTLATLPTAPTYVKPTISLAAVPTDFSISATPPTTPSAPSISSSDAAAGSIASTTIAALPTAPSYSASLPSVPTYSFTGIGTAPTALDVPDIIYTNASASTSAQTFTNDLSSFYTTFQTYLDTNFDIDAANGKLSEIRQKVEEFQSVNQMALQQALSNAQSTTDLNEKNAHETLAGQIANYDAALKKYVEELDKYKIDINTKYQEFQLNLQVYVKDSDIVLQDALNTFNKDVVAYQAAIQRNIQQAQLDQQRLISSAQMTTDVDEKNKLNSLNAAIADYESVLKKYVEDLHLYELNVNSEVQVFSANLRKWEADRQTTLAQYTADVQNNTEAFNSAVVEYQAKVNYAIEQARLDQQRLVESAKLTTDVAKQNAIETMAAAVQEYEETLKKFNAELQYYVASVDKDYKTFQLEVQVYQNDTQAALQKSLETFNADNVAYQAEIAYNVKQAELDAQRLQITAQMTTDLDIKNAAEDLQAQIADYSAQLQLFQSEVQTYNIEVNEQVAEVTSKMQKYTGEIQAMEFLYKSIMEQYQIALTALKEG